MKVNSMKRIKYALFDLDGTLIDTKEGIIAAVVYTINKFGKDIPKQSVLEGMIGPPIQESFQRLYNLSDSEAIIMANEFREIYKKEDVLFKATPYSGIYELLQMISEAGIIIGIATYKREDYAVRLLKEKGFDKYTKYIYGADYEGKLKKQDIIKRCLLDMGCMNMLQAVYIGYTESDGLSASSIGMDFIAVTYGFGFKNKEDTNRYSPVGIASCCKQLEEIILT